MTLWTFLFGRSRQEQDLKEEIESHLQMATRDHIRFGNAPDEASFAVQREFGNVTLIEETTRDAWGWTWLEDLFRDVRYTVRGLLKSPGFGLTAVFTLALGIGACTAIFSVVDAVLLRPLPYPKSQQILRIWEEDRNGHLLNLANANFQDFRTQNKTFAYLAEYSGYLTSISGGHEPVRGRVAAVSSGFFDALGIKPFLGRDFSEEEHRASGAPAAIVSHAYWEHYLGATTDLSKLRIHLLTGFYPVIGVMPAAFDYPADAAVWIPNELNRDIGSRTAHNWQAIGRVYDGITIAKAHADLNTIARRLKAQYGKYVDLNDVAVMLLAEATVGNVRVALLTLAGAVGLLLLVAYTNVAGLLLARTSARRKELAICVALGAGRFRLIQQFLFESLVLTLGGGLLGVLLAVWAVRALPAISPANLPRQQEIAINTQVLLFALGAIVAVAVSLGLFAAWRAGRGDAQEDLTAGSRTYAGNVTNQRFRSFLVIGEIAMTLLILIGAGLLGRSFLRLISITPGFLQTNLVSIQFSASIPRDVSPNDSTVARQILSLDDLVTRLRSIPGVQSLGLAGAMPVVAGDNLSEGSFLILNGRRQPADFYEWERIAQDHSHTGHALYAVASEGYFRTLGIRPIRGRIFSDLDRLDSPHVAVISQTLARNRWPTQDPIGQVINFGNMDGNLKPLTIVGVVGDIRARGLNAPPAPIVYVNYRQRGMGLNSSPTILIRTTAPLGQIASPARKIFHDLAPDVPVRFSLFTDEMGGWLADRRFLLFLVCVFAVAALALAAVGIYGVVAFSVTRRTQEIGLRMALGALRVDVLRLIVGEGARMALAGVFLGIAASLLITRVLTSLLFGVSATDPITFTGMVVFLSLIALLASYIPARRATKIDPMVALRYE